MSEHIGEPIESRMVPTSQRGGLIQIPQDLGGPALLIGAARSRPTLLNRAWLCLASDDRGARCTEMKKAPALGQG